jgi:L-xylulokinase
MSELLLGIDSGLTVTKAVVFTPDGRPLGSGAVPSQQHHPREGWVEKDPDEQWTGAQQAIAQAVKDAGVEGSDIAAVGVSGHGDGLYTLDEQGRPARPAILSLDGRAGALAQRWQREGIAARALEVAGQVTFAVEPPVLLGWVKENEPEVYRRIRQVLFCKDWLKLQLTGRVTTDATEASAGFTNVATQGYDPEVMAIYGLEDKSDALPEIVGSCQTAGTVTAGAASATGLREGTPVVSGLHDCDASAAGSGCVRPGQLTMIAGTFSINEVISTDPVGDPRIFCRNWVEPGQWMNMGNSAASATNLEWFVGKLAPLEVERAERLGVSPFAFASEEVEATLDDPSRVLYLPFLYGAPDRPDATGVFCGLKGWHTRGHLLRALFEGVAFNHRTHVDALRDYFEVREARLTGGGARSNVWVRIFADALGLPVSLTDAREAGALGAALCAAVAAGVHPTLADAADQAIHVTRSFEPNPRRRAELEEVYQRYLHLVETLQPAWERATAAAGA